MVLLLGQFVRVFEKNHAEKTGLRKRD